MQIGMITGNNMHYTVGKAARIKSQSVQAAGGMFGAPYKVTISKEGRKLSEQRGAQTARSAQSLKTEKLMIRQQEQSEQLEKQSKELKKEYVDLLDEISKTVKITSSSYLSKTDPETLEKKVQLLHAMGNQKQKQLEENQKQAQYAQDMAMQSSKAQDEIDKNNRDLLIMLKSIEESEKAEEENGGESEESGSNGAKTENRVGDAIQDSATRFTASSVKRELDVVGMIRALNGEGHDYLSRADEITWNAYDEADGIRNILDDEHFTIAEKKDAVLHFGAKMIGALGSSDAFKQLDILLDDNAEDADKEEALAIYRARMSEDSDLGKYRQRGIQMIKDAKEGKLKHIEDNPLQGMEETKDSMVQSAVDAVFNEASQSKLDETSQELEDAVEELIDERNDIDHVESEEKKDEEDQEKIGELLEPKNDEDDPNAEEEHLLKDVLES